MKTRVLAVNDWQAGIDSLREGEVIAIPTDTVYGLAVMPLDGAAIDRLYAAKDRPAEKAIPMLVASLADAERIATLDGSARALCAAFWPGALTVVALAAPDFQSPALASDGTVALRMPAHALALRIIAAAGGVLAVTSANRSGEPPARSAEGVVAQLDGRIALVIDDGPSPGGVASSVVRAGRGGVEVLREGALSREVLEAALHAASG